ncbi:MAG: hypothetical protein RL630_1058 [Verrucomicrobiota bacterium]|jgi:hypothetical protein
MPSFPCDNSDDFVPDEMYDSVRDEIRTQRQKLGRPLTEEEIAEIYITEGLEPPREVYCGGRTYVDYGFNMEEFEEEIYDGVRDKIKSKTKEFGRYLTKEEIKACFIAEGIEPPLNCYEDAYGDGEEEGYASMQIDEKPLRAEENESEDSSQSEAIKVPFSEEALREVEAVSPRAAEYWRGLQAISQKHGINSTFTIRKKPPSDTKKVRFVFLEKGSSPTDSEAKPSE